MAIPTIKVNLRKTHFEIIESDSEDQVAKSTVFSLNELCLRLNQASIYPTQYLTDPNDAEKQFINPIYGQLGLNIDDKSNHYRLQIFKQNELLYDINLDPTSLNNPYIVSWIRDVGQGNVLNIHKTFIDFLIK